MESQPMFPDCPAYGANDGAARCRLPAEAELRCTVRSTGGPPESATIRSPRGHRLNGPIEFLTGIARSTLGTIMAATTAASTEIPVTSSPGLPPRRLPATMAAAITLVLAMTAALIFIAVSRGLAAGPGGCRTGTPIVVPHPTPGPFGS